MVEVLTVKNYSSERSVQILISLMKAHGIKKVVISPGMKNMSVVASLQCDSFFELYSCVDERSAAYMACGLAEESGESVALSCTGATASRNYFSALTEAYYRKLPILAITSMNNAGEIGQLIPQIIDRRDQPNDVVKLSVQVPAVRCDKDEWSNNVLINNALLELRHRGGGPVHINLETIGSKDFSVQELPPTRVIRRICQNDVYPDIVKGRICIFVGAHKAWSKRLTDLVDKFCEIYNAVVICDHTSNYTGEYGVQPNLVLAQKQYQSPLASVALMIHIGDVSGAYISMKPDKVWRVNPDGEVRDTFKKLEYVFEMEEEDFFEHYTQDKDCDKIEDSYYQSWKSEYNGILEKTPDLPFSNIWIAKETLPVLPENSRLYLGILNSLRCWNFFEKDKSIIGYSNTGGFGIDGGLSTIVGMSLVNKGTLYFGVLGDLSFFYDMNALGNRHIGNNIRLMIINNGRGVEFRNYGHPCAEFGEDADPYMAAAGHFGNKSPDLLKHYAEDLGFQYLSANNKEEFSAVLSQFVTDRIGEKSIVLEVFTDTEDERLALETVSNLKTTVSAGAKSAAKKLLGEKNYQTVKKLLKK